MSATGPKLPPEIFDRARIASRLSRHHNSEIDFVTQLVIDDLAERLAPISRTFAKALIIGPNAALLPTSGQTANGPFTFSRASTLCPKKDTPIVDPENFAPPQNDYDLIVSVLDLQVVNDVPGFLTRLRTHLAPDGLLLLAAIGGNSLNELRSAWLTADAEISGGAFARIAPFIDIRDAGTLLQHAGFALPVTDVEQHIVRYASPLALMQELKNLGASNPLQNRPKQFTTGTMLAAACTAYQDMAGDDDGRVRATLEIIWLSGWAPHESQQQPLKPGSAKISLTRVLGKTPKQKSEKH